MNIRALLAAYGPFFLTKKGIAAALGAVLLVGAGGYFLFAGNGELSEEATKMREVKVRNVGALSASGDPIPVVGVVSSQSEVTLRAETSGVVTRVYKKLGDTVRSGEIVAQVENSRERAELLRAQGSLESARAQFDKTERSEGIAGQSVVASQTAFESAVRNAYIVSDDAIRNKIDQFFESPRSPLPKIIPAFKDDTLEKDINRNRLLIEELLVDWQKSFDVSVTPQNREEIFLKTKERLSAIEQFLNLVALAVNKFEPLPNISQTSIDAYKAATGAARSAASGAQSALSSAYNALNAQLAQSSSAAAYGALGQSEDVAIAGGNLKQAEAALLSARANYEKTLIRAPITGTLNALYIEQGNLVNPGEEAGVLANNTTLKIKTAVTEDERRQIAVGGEAVIEKSISGTITEIAPALDPRTGKIEVSVSIPEGSRLVNGESVSIDLQRERAEDSPAGQVAIPLSAVKIEPTRTVVFTVSEEGVLIAHEIETGSILGDRIVVISGITTNMDIVVDARGLREGASVVVED